MDDNMKNRCEVKGTNKGIMNRVRVVERILIAFVLHTLPNNRRAAGIKVNRMRQVQRTNLSRGDSQIGN